MYAAALIAELLKAYGKKFFVYPGGTIAPIFHECKAAGVELLCSKAEQGAGYMAIADAALTGGPAFVAVTSGPGATNLVTCIADAFYDSLPLVVFTGQVGTVDLGRSQGLRQRGFQEVPTPQMVASITKGVWQPKTIDQLQTALIDGVQLALEGRQGPVVIDLPMNLQMSSIGASACHVFANRLAESRRGGHGPLQPCPVEFPALVASALAGAKRPLVLVGAGAIDASEAVRTLAERWQLPVISSMRGIGALPSDHSLAVGWIGHTGQPWANRTLFEADCLLVLGSRLDVRQTGTELAVFDDKKIFRVDIDAAELEYSRLSGVISAHCSVRTFLGQMAVIAPHEASRGEWLEEIQGFRNSFCLADHGELTGIAPDELLRHLDRATRDKATTVVTGVGSHQQWAARYFTFDFPRKRLLTSAGHGTMGYALPVALGAANVDRETLILCVDGDGSFQLNIQELALALELNLPIKIVLMDNSRLGIVSQFQCITFADDPVTGDFQNPDFCAIAKAYGLAAHRLETLIRPLSLPFAGTRPGVVARPDSA
ncbi:MAG: thiamine pyrophosphate-binding protein [Syntrophotaleaceae bacterium]